MITDLTTKRIEAQSERQIYLRVLPTRYRQKSTGIDRTKLRYGLLSPYGYKQNWFQYLFVVYI